MKKRTLLAGLMLLVAACGDTGVEVADELPTSEPSAREDTTVPTESIPPTDDGAGGTTQPGEDSGEAQAPEANEAPPTTLELAPATTKVPTASSDGPPAGSGTALYEGQIDPGLQPFIEVAIADLAPRLDASESDIVALSAVLVTWSDSSMGCPQPGMEYAQLLQDGSVIELGYNGRVYRYHTGGQRNPFLCDQPLTIPPVPGGGSDA